MKSEITIKTVRCKGCGICAAFCPKSVLAVSELGKILDPVADKLTQITIAVMLYIAFRSCNDQLMVA